MFEQQYLVLGNLLTCPMSKAQVSHQKNIVDVVVNFLSQLIFIFPLFWGMVMYVNEF